MVATRKTASPTEFKRLTEMVADGRSILEIVKAMDRSKTWVVNHSRAIREAVGVTSAKRHIYTPQEDAKIQAMRTTKQSVRKIAAVLGVSCTSLKGRIGYADVHSRTNMEAIQGGEGGFHRVPMEDVRAWMRDEVKRMRRLAERSGWVTKRVKRTGKKVAA